MAIKILKDTDITLYDKANVRHATQKDILSLTITANKDFVKTICHLIADSLYLNDSERDLYYMINISPLVDNKISIDILISATIYRFHKIEVTYKRAINTLIKKGVVKYNDNRTTISIIDEYNIGKVNSNIQYAVIEIKPSGKDL